jgi:hypothetical protein
VKDASNMKALSACFEFRFRPWRQAGQRCFNLVGPWAEHDVNK